MPDHLRFVDHDYLYNEKEKIWSMKKYKVEICKVKKAEALMNSLANQGWKVVSIMPNHAVGYGMVITFEIDE